MRIHVRLAGIAVLMVLMGACGANSPFAPTTEGQGSGSITYRVTGSTTSTASVTYATGSGGTAQFSRARLPWSSVQTGFISGQFMYVSAQNDEASGCITVEIVRRNDVLKSAFSCGAYVIATASGSY